MTTMSVCLLCNCHLAVNSRRVLNPVTTANAEVHQFTKEYIRPSYKFGEDTVYICRPCFSNLYKAMRLLRTLQDLLTKLEAPGLKSVVHVATGASGNMTTQTDSPSSIQVCSKA